MSALLLGLKGTETHPTGPLVPPRMLLVVMVPFFRLPKLRVFGLEFRVLDLLLCRLPCRREAQVRSMTR
jgi:hypothetical protein